MLAMENLELLDTFPAFSTFWENCGDLPVEAQIQQWAHDYLSPWPDLLVMQVDDYRQQNLDWQAIARERIFPHLPERLPAMAMARANLLAVGETVYERALETLGVSTPAVFVIHVGIGCGAGWVTRFRGSPAILFGLENIAECGWQDKAAITGLVAHEMGHLAHSAWRDQGQQTMGSGPWWQLYEEGFAQYCESLLVAPPGWHQVCSDSEWLGWCQDNLGWLAAEFLRRVEAGEAVTPFFGSWFDLRGHKETGYYLGCEVVQRLTDERSVHEIALLEDPERVLRLIVENMALGSRY
jgi:hypothetical protein